MKWLTRLLSTVDYDNITDEVTLTLLHKKILRQKKVLRRLYENYYRRHLSLLTTEMDYHTYPILEIGAGGGFFKEACPSAITSDVLPLDSNDIVFSATRIPLKAETISNIVLLNVLHHINSPFEFFSEAERVLVRGGRLIMTEPQIGLLSYIIHKYVNHEPCDYHTNTLSLKEYGYLKNANTALPSLIFHKRNKQFHDSFPNLKIVGIQYHTLLSYLLSGGLRYRSLIPTNLLNVVLQVDKMIEKFGRLFTIMMTVILQKQR